MLAKFEVHAEVYGEEKKYPSPPMRTFSLGNILEISINPYFTSKKIKNINTYVSNLFGAFFAPGMM